MKRSGYFRMALELLVLIRIGDELASPGRYFVSPDDQPQVCGGSTVLDRYIGLPVQLTLRRPGKSPRKKPKIIEIDIVP